MKKLHLKLILVAIVVLIVIGYAYGRTEAFIKGPRITVTYPKNGSALKESRLEIRGTTEHAARLLLNGRGIFINEEGEFNEIVFLFPGYNILTLKAEDTFKRIVTKELELVYLEK